MRGLRANICSSHEPFAAPRLLACCTTALLPMMRRRLSVRSPILDVAPSFCLPPVRDDRPFAGPAPPAAVYYASSDRRGEHPQRHLAAFAGILQADCYSGFEPLLDPQKKALPITPAFCLAHARRGFFELADIEKNAREGKKGKPVSPIALEAVS